MEQSKIDSIAFENTQELIRKDLLLETSVAEQNKSKNSTGWEQIGCFCKWSEHKETKPFGYLTTLKDGVKYVIFLRKCAECGKLRGNFELSKPKQKEITL